jgi:hypothetical protein
MIDLMFAPEPATKGKPVTERIRAWDATTGRRHIPTNLERLRRPMAAMRLGGRDTAASMPYPPTMIAVDGAHVRHAGYSVTA